jgi:hypothetical protein
VAWMDRVPRILNVWLMSTQRLPSGSVSAGSIQSRTRLVMRSKRALPFGIFLAQLATGGCAVKLTQAALQ